MYMQSCSVFQLGKCWWVKNTWAHRGQQMAIMCTSLFQARLCDEVLYTYIHVHVMYVQLYTCTYKRK